MATSIFEDKANQPDEKKLAEALGDSYVFWENIKTHLAETYGELTEEWKFYNPKSGWQLKTLRKKRNLFFFTPVENGFNLVFVFGDKAVAVVEESDLPNKIKKTLREARKYAEGRGLQIEVESEDDVENVKKLVEIKINN